MHDGNNDLTRIDGERLLDGQDLPQRAPRYGEPLTVAQFRGVVQDALDTYLANTRYATPIARVIARAQCEDGLVEHYAVAALAVVERDQLRDTLQRFENVLDLLLAVGG